MSDISTHILDLSRGRPAAGVAVTLERMEGTGIVLLARGTTNEDGRIPGFDVEHGSVTAGKYRLVFRTADYFHAWKVESFYPEVVVVFEIREATQRYHVPLLLSPFGYSTYRGS